MMQIKLATLLVWLVANQSLAADELCTQSVQDVLKQHAIATASLPAEEMKYCASLVQDALLKDAQVLAIASVDDDGQSFRDLTYVFARNQSANGQFGEWRGGRFVETFAPSGGKPSGPDSCFGHNLERPFKDGDYFYFGSHVSPSAGCLTVFRLSRDRLELWDGFYNLHQAPFAQENILLTGPMIHFAPSHPMKLFFYRPKTRTHELIYPKLPDAKHRAAFVKQLGLDYQKIAYEVRAKRNHHFDPQELTQDIQVEGMSAELDAVLLVTTRTTIQVWKWSFC